MVKSNSNRVTDIFIGGTIIEKIYCGSNVVWQRSSESSSCFGGDTWDDNLLWDDNDTW